MQTETDIETLSFEAAMKELEQIVRRLESGSTELESALRDYARGAALQRHCQKRLDEARLKVDAVVKAADGSISLKPFESQQA